MKITYFVIITILFTSTLLIGVTANTYDPWCDLDQNGEIDIFDVVDIAGRYGTSGTPVNRTELLMQNSGYFPTPAYDSGWLSVNPDMGENITLIHNLNTTEVFVYLIGQTDTGYVHQGNYGFNYYPFLAGGGQLGTRWFDLNATCIKLVRGNKDAYSPSVSWNYTRIMIWKIWTP